MAENKKEDVTFVILGATGDLTKRKLIPAIYRLVENKKISKFALVGAAKSETSIEEFFSQAKKFLPRIDAKIWNSLLKHSYYLQLDFYKEEDFTGLKDKLAEVEKKHKLSGNRIFYLATLPQHFDKITYHLDKSKMAKGGIRKWSRVVYEKPFGDDLSSAKRINRCVNRVFKEKQVYRIDHYLGKELVGDISIMRFTNRILEPLWCSSHIDSVQIVLSEKIGVGERGEFYDRYGALKDVIQNHALQLLALTAMEPPRKLSGEHLRSEKAKVLRRTRLRSAVLGQYAGYRKEKGVKKNSETETFAALHLEVDNERWKGVPFYVRAGKNLDKKETSITIKFKEVGCLLAQNCPSDTNYFTIKIQPDDGFEMELNSKVPGKKEEVIPVKMDFCQECRFGPNTPEAYETLLEDVIRGDQSVFVRNDEIEYAWKIIDKISGNETIKNGIIKKRTIKKRNKIYLYKKGSEGPKEFKVWSRHNGLRWKR